MRVPRFYVVIGVALVVTLIVNWATNSILAWNASYVRGYGGNLWGWMQSSLDPKSSWEYPPGFVVAPAIAFLLAAFSGINPRGTALLVVPLVIVATILIGLLVGRDYYGNSNTARYLTVFSLRVLIVFGGSSLATRRVLSLPQMQEVQARNSSRTRRTRGFTLIEILIVIAILGVLAAILTPVLVRAKKSANVAADIGQMRQTYLAIKLYEEDTGEMPPNLTYLVPHYLPKEILHGVGDPRPTRADGTYPAAMSCEEVLDGPGACPRSKYMVSYAYLKTFEGRFKDWTQGVTFAELKTHPEMGLLAALHHADRTYPGPDFYSSDPSGGKIFDSGIFLRTRMDGSTKILRMNWGETNQCAWEHCFLR